MRTLFTLLLVLTSIDVFSFRYVIYTDQLPPTKAREVVEYFETTVPFSEFEMDIEIQLMTSEEMNCRPSNGIERLIVCDTVHLHNESFMNNFDQAFVVSDNPVWGGSGGLIPTMTTSEQMPVSVMGHEYMHRLGFHDEYQYSPEEAEMFCTESVLNALDMNVVLIEPLESGYAGNAHARAEHMSEIPWAGYIENDTLIATSTLGNPAEHGDRLGLFPALTCSRLTPAVHGWKAGGVQTLMESLYAPIGPYEEMLRDALASLGLNHRADDRQTESDNDTGHNQRMSDEVKNKRDCHTDQSNLPLDIRYFRDTFQPFFRDRGLSPREADRTQ